MRKFLSLFCVFLFVAFSTGCKDNPVAPPDTTSTMSILDASCTEAVISISMKGSSLPLRLTLKRNDSTIALITLIHADTVYIDTLLQPGHTYTYTMLWGNNTRSTQARTMDTTAHDWAWQAWTFGGASSSLFYDVAIINDTLAFAVGEVYMYDTTGKIDPNPYNLAVWNGKEWTLKRLLANGVSPIMLQSVYAVNEHDVWLTPWFHWDGKEFKQMPSDPIFYGIGIYRMWGDSTGLYAVGTAGFIGHRDRAGRWTRLASGTTTLNVYDIKGAYNEATGNEEIVAVAADIMTSPEKKLFMIKGKTVTEVSTVGIPSSIYAIWLHPGRQYIAIGAGIFEKRAMPDPSAWKSISPSQYYIYCIAGSDINDLLLGGAYGELLHFNGATWRSYQATTYIAGDFFHLAVKNNLCIAVGYAGRQAITLIGRR